MPNYYHNISVDDAKLMKMLPPQEALKMPGDGDFLTIGKHFATLLKDRCGLNGKSSVLDVGCSIGRNAIPLTQLISEGRYEGFDVVKDGIDYATKYISSLYPNFTFTFVDVFNGVYNNSTKAQNPQEFRFPYEKNTFDIVFLVSVFTHMRAKDVAAYLKEISRVTKRGGKTLITYFLLNDYTKQALSQGTTDRSFPYEFENYQASDQVWHEGAIAYREDYLKKLYETNNLKVTEVLMGSWAKYPDPVSYQDIIIASKL